jgi:hypothetical protein
MLDPILQSGGFIWQRQKRLSYKRKETDLSFELSIFIVGNIYISIDLWWNFLDIKRDTLPPNFLFNVVSEFCTRIQMFTDDESCTYNLG